MYVSVDGYTFWLPNTLKQLWLKKKRKSKQTSHSLFNARIRHVCLNTASHLCCHHPSVYSAWAQVRAEQHTLISVFKLNSFKSQKTRMRTHAGHEKICVCAYWSAQNHVSERVQILSSHSILVLTRQILTKTVSTCHLGKYSSRHIWFNI